MEFAVWEHDHGGPRIFNIEANDNIKWALQKTKDFLEKACIEELLAEGIHFYSSFTPVPYLRTCALPRKVAFRLRSILAKFRPHSRFPGKPFSAARMFWASYRRRTRKVAQVEASLLDQLLHDNTVSISSLSVGHANQKSLEVGVPLVDWFSTITGGKKLPYSPKIHRKDRAKTG